VPRLDRTLWLRQQRQFVEFQNGNRAVTPSPERSAIRAKRIQVRSA
jgi:hypothetical protein